MQKKRLLSLFIFIFLVSCMSKEEIVKRIDETLTAIPSFTQLPTYTNYPTYTKYPTFTPSPTITFTPTNNPGEWQTHGPFINSESFISDLIIDPQTPTTLYASIFDNQLINEHPIFKSIDGGWSWQPIGNDLAGNNVFTMAIDPITTTTIYICTMDHGVYKSEDGGQNWVSTNNGFNETDIHEVDIDPNNPNFIYAVSSDHLYKSENGGMNWRRIDYGFISDYGWHSLLVDQNTSSTLYAIHSTMRETDIWKSINSGSKWVLLSHNEMVFGLAQVFAIDVNYPNTFYIGTNVGLVKSINSGKDWVFIKSDLENNSIWSLALNGTAIYFGTQDMGVYKSINGGENWISLGLKDYSIYDLEIDPKNQNLIFAATINGIYFLDQSYLLNN